MVWPASARGARGARGARMYLVSTNFFHRGFAA